MTRLSLSSRQPVLEHVAISPCTRAGRARRKEPKKHGTQKFVEWLEATEGNSVVILDDGCTKSDSTWQAIVKAQDAGMRALGAICLMDRLQGATETLAG